MNAPPAGATNAATVLLGFSMTAFFVLVPGFLQSPEFGFALSPTAAGLLLLPFSLAMIAAGPVAGALGTRRGRVLPLRIGLTLGAGSLAGLALLHADKLLFAAWLPIMGAGMAFALAAIGALVIDHSRPEETGVTSGMNTIMRTVGAALGSQVAAAIISANTIAGTEIPAESGFTLAFTISAVGALVALGPTFLLRRRVRVAVPA